MLIGRQLAKIDEKGRIAFPKKFREALGEKLIIAQGFEGSLIVVSAKVWKTLLEGTEGLPFTDRSVRETQRFLLGSAEEVTLDEKGRFILPHHLREYGQLSSEVVCLGILRYVEIWDKKRWDEHNKKLTDQIEPITKKLSDLPAGRRGRE